MSITILPRFVGELVTVAHSAIVHACTIDDEVLTAMGAIILDGAEIGARAIIGTNALVTLGKKIPPARSSLVPPQKSNARSLAKNRKTSRGGPGVTSKSQNISANSTRPVAGLYERRIFLVPAVLDRRYSNFSANSRAFCRNNSRASEILPPSS